MAEGITNTPETPWVDAWVRWERNSKALCDDGDGAVSDEDEELPPPTETYNFIYPRNGEEVITLELKGYHDDSEQTWNSTGLTLWRSSHHLCHYLVSEEAEMLQDKSNNNLRILEVGSGLGRCGLLAHKLSHEDATTVLTDGDTDALKLLRRNVRHNIKDDDTNISCKQLLWGKAYAKTFLAQQPDERKFEVILGSDLIYVKMVIRPLFETIRELLSDDAGSKFLMAHCARREGNEVEFSMILDVANEEEFEYEELVQEDDISLYCFRHKQKS